MAMKNFEKALKPVLSHEGGFVNLKADPGGPTNKGVTQRVYDSYRRGKGLTPRSVKSITTDELNAIYRLQYWDAVKGDQLPTGVDYVVFDGAVNSGPGQSIKWLQRALGPLYKGGIDGVMGVGTIAAVNAVNNHDALIDRICDQRLNFLRHLTTWPTFGRGWGARVSEVRSIGKAWATGETPTAASFVDGGQAKAFIEDAKAAPATAPADAAAGAGVGGLGVSGTLQQLQDQLSPLSYASELVGRIVVILAVVSALLAVGGIGYSVYARRKAARLAEALSTGPA